ncbi:MAG: hypothetical protein GY809_12950, partial [Planctomycetes bacterium]|nr:hypothetical protein [Planctomycetota bacterium]
FDADRIEAMKKDLARSLKYATNIRRLPANEQIIVRLRSVASDSVIEETQFQRGDQAYGRGRSGGMSISVHDKPPASILVMRTRKSDVDAFAKGTVDFDTFYRSLSIAMH